MTDPSDPVIQNKREFSRVDAHLPLEIRLVLPEERQYIRSRLEKQQLPAYRLPPNVEDSLLAEWLNLLNAKLDRILNLLAANREASDRSAFRSEDISGGGISFTSPEAFQLGDLLEIKMTSGAALRGMLLLYGEVVQTEKREGSSFTAIRFILLDEDVRDEIIRFVFEKERELLREKGRTGI